MNKILAFAIALGLTISANVVFGQQVFYVQSLKAKVMGKPSFKSIVMAEVGKGHKFLSTGKEGNWIKVKLDSRDGYVSSLLLSRHKPIPRQTLIKAEDDDLRAGVRRRASTYTSAAAARGLTQEKRRRISKEEKADYFAIEKIESLKVTQEEVTKFMDGGKI